MNEWIEKIQQLNWKQADRAAPILLVLLILYLCWKLASIFWLLVAPPQVMQVEPIALGSQQAQVPNIAAFALFQEVGGAAAADESANLLLQGVMVGYPSQFSSAVIKMNEVADRYRVGENIANTSYQLAEVCIGIECCYAKVMVQPESSSSKGLKMAWINRLFSL